MTEQEIMLILNVVAYSNTLQEKDFSNRNLDDIINSIKKPSTVPKNDWDKIVNTIKTKKEFSDIKLVKNKYTKNKELNILFTNSKNEALVVYKGTGMYEWHDNADGGQWNVVSTEQQKNAKNFVDTYCNGYDRIVVSGHSKGGNKAQYVAIMSNTVNKAYSFDGQGMGYNFILANKKLIEKNANKITMYNYSSDFVNPLFINMGVKDVNYVLSDKTITNLLIGLDTTNLMLLHSPDKMLDFSGQEIKLKQVGGVKQDSVATLINGLTEYMMLHLNQKDWHYFSNMMVHMFEGEKNGEIDCSDNFSKAEMPKNFIAHVLNEGIAYLTEKMGLSASDTMSLISILLYRLVGDSLFKYSSQSKKYIDNFTAEELEKKINSIVVSTTGNDIVRNYTQKMQDEFEKLVKESQDDAPIYEFWNWDVWTKVEDYFNGGYTLQDAGNDLKKYRKHMIDMEDITLRESKKIFDNVYQADKEFAESIKSITKSISKAKKDIEENLIDCINI